VPNSNNLALEPVNLSSRKEIILHLPQRVFDLLLKPYPWQHYDWSQRFAAIGSLIEIGLLVLLIRYAWRNRGAIFRRTGPLLYPTLLMLIAFALSVGNAGTGFRYRAHLLIPAIGMVAVLWARSQAAARAGRRGAHRVAAAPRSGVLPSGEPSPVAPAMARRAHA
jgi:hypothetical protein